MSFQTEKQFEDALIALLFEKGWEHEVLMNPTEEDLLANWASILFENNRGRDCLNNHPLTDGEMAQIIDKIKTLRTPLKLNGFINGKSVAIKRDNPGDAAHFGREVSLKIYDRFEIAQGKSRYQIARQPRFRALNPMLGNRRGDLMLLINGMPVFHIELKRGGIPESQAVNQIEKYARQGIFSGLFSLVQVFVAMNPDKAVYFANPGPDGRFNPDYQFHWADFNNEPIDDWRGVASAFLHIPMAHQMIGFYTVADTADGVLKVMRSYQYYAANAISDRVAKNKWEHDNQRGGYVWHTTGSGKTMTSFKSAQLIAQSGDADKVVFLVDRIELGTQSLKEYRSFAEESESVQATESGIVLKAKLKSASADETLIVTSIQKMSGIRDEEGGINAQDLAAMRAKRIVFIVDECHRSVFGEMLRGIKATFPRAIFFGFTGTPIHDENQKKDNTTADVFGDELHRYSIADGIRDKNVLGFDLYRVETYKQRELRKAVALAAAKAQTEAEALADPKKKAVYYRFMNDVPMAGFVDGGGRYVKGIEDYLPASQYDRDEHRETVVGDIADNWLTLSRGGNFHAIFATASIPEAIAYYRLIKARLPDLKITALFDPTIGNDNPDGAGYKEDGLVEILTDYNARFGMCYTLANHAQFKKDVASRLAHKDAHKGIEIHAPQSQLNLLVVVNQMMTGFDSKWVNTLYLDKCMEDANIIQAFSRTNRLFGHEKPFGTIRYYRKPFTMGRNIDAAVKLYSGDKPLALFADKLPENLRRLNAIYADIASLFAAAGISNFGKLPGGNAARGKFASLFNRFNAVLEAAKIQGFEWGRPPLDLDEQTYLILVLRYKELAGAGAGGGAGGGDIPYEIEGYLTEINTEKIDADYMNSNFEKYLKLLRTPDASGIEQALAELHKTFATLTQEEQKFASIILHDIESGAATIEGGKTFRDLITGYQARAKDNQIHRLATALGLDEAKLRELMGRGVTEATLDEHGRYTELRATVDKAKARTFFENKEGKPMEQSDANMETDSLLRRFILNGGHDI